MRNLRDVEIVLIAFLATLVTYALVGGQPIESAMTALVGALAMAARSGRETAKDA